LALPHLTFAHLTLAHLTLAQVILTQLSFPKLMMVTHCLLVCVRLRRWRARIISISRRIAPHRIPTLSCSRVGTIPTVRLALGWRNRFTSSRILSSRREPTTTKRSMLLMMNHAGSGALRFMGIWGRSTRFSQIERLR